MRIGFTPREGLVLHTVSYEDQGRERPVLYRASIADMVVPYGDPRPTYFHRNAFDVGEYGIGTLANALENGCDCLGEIRYLDAVVNDGQGRPVTLANAICLHEEDAGILWKHFDWRLGTTEVRRSRRLVVSSISTVGNYEYGFYWYFYQDGTIQLEVKLTGVISNGAEPPGDKPRWGEMVAPGVYGPIHQHFFNARLDMMVDGLDNSVYEVNTVADAPGPENPHHNAFHAEATLLASEGQAQRVLDPLAGRFWKVVNPSVRNRLGEPVAYKLMPGENVLPFAGPEASVTKRAAFMTRHLWVTRHDPRERYAAGEYPNQHPGGAGLPTYVRDDAPLENTDVVALVHLRRAPHRPPRGLAGDAGGHDRLHAQARRVLRPQPGARRAPPDAARECCEPGERLEHGLDQVGAGGGEAGRELLVELLRGGGAARGHAHAARQRDPVEIRAADVEHVGRLGAGRAGADAGQLVPQDRVRAVGEDHGGHVEAFARLRPERLHACTCRCRRPRGTRPCGRGTPPRRRWPAAGRGRSSRPCCSSSRGAGRPRSP